MIMIAIIVLRSEAIDKATEKIKIASSVDKEAIPDVCLDLKFMIHDLANPTLTSELSRVAFPE